MCSYKEQIQNKFTNKSNIYEDRLQPNEISTSKVTIKPSPGVYRLLKPTLQTSNLLLLSLLLDYAWNFISIYNQHRKIVSSGSPVNEWLTNGVDIQLTTRGAGQTLRQNRLMNLSMSIKSVAFPAQLMNVLNEKPGRDMLIDRWSNGFLCTNLLIL